MEYKSFNSESQAPYICSGEQRLCIAVLIQAIKDIHYSSKKKSHVKGTTPQRVEEEALRWVLSDRYCPFSFIWCLEHALPDFYEHIDLAELRNLVLSKPLACRSVSL